MSLWLVTQVWSVEVPDDVDDPQDWARDYVLSVNCDSEDIEEIKSDDD